jgi:tetratricopeptide (TPR) repeat protein
MAQKQVSFTRLSAALLIALPLTSCRDGARSQSTTLGGDPSAHPALDTQAVSKITFIEDDYPRALKEAKAKGKPIFADTWATWCHSCMSMKQFVLPAPEMQVLSGDFVWLSVDCEKAENADFLERFPSTSIPTLWVIDPANERAVLKWVGAATAPELVTLLGDASRARTEKTVGEAATATLRGDQASAAGKLDDAVAAYREALAQAPADWTRRPRIVEALSLRLSDAGRYAECVELAAKEIPHLPAGTPLANLVMNGLGAAAELPSAAPQLEHVPLLIREGTRIAEENSTILVDDRSGLFQALVAALADRPDEAKRLARRWAEVLEGAASQAKSRESRAVWDAHRLEAYIATGEVQKAVPMLEQSERDFPDDYSAPFRLARAYFELGRYEPALVEIARALERAHGPRKLRIFMLKADILEKKNDRPGARRAIGEAIEFADQLRLPPNYRKVKTRLTQRYAELGSPPT